MFVPFLHSITPLFLIFVLINNTQKGGFQQRCNTSICALTHYHKKEHKLNTQKNHANNNGNNYKVPN